MRAILVPFSDRPEAENALHVAAGFADRVGGNIIGCHLRPHRDSNKGYKPRGLPLFGNADRAALEALSRKGSETATNRARKKFTAIVEECGYAVVRRPRLNLEKGAMWNEMVGVPDKLMAIQGPVVDLTVVSRPAANAQIGQMFMAAALLHTGRPVFIAPPTMTHAPGKHIAIAWNQGAEVARAVSACMPLLQAAQDVTIISAGREDRLGPKAGQLQAYLKLYGVKAEVLTSRGRSEEQELDKAYKKSGADLMIMGAYSRARLRELVFGGMTHYMLTKGKIPVIMQHS